MIQNWNLVEQFLCFLLTNLTKHWKAYMQCSHSRQTRLFVYWLWHLAWDEYSWVQYSSKYFFLRDPGGGGGWTEPFGQPPPTKFITCNQAVFVSLGEIFRWKMPLSSLEASYSHTLTARLEEMCGEGLQGKKEKGAPHFSFFPSFPVLPLPFLSLVLTSKSLCRGEREKKMQNEEWSLIQNVYGKSSANLFEIKRNGQSKLLPLHNTSCSINLPVCPPQQVKITYTHIHFRPPSELSSIQLHTRYTRSQHYVECAPEHFA